MELQKAQGPDLAPNPVKQAFFERKKSICGGLKILIFFGVQDPFLKIYLVYGILFEDI